MPNKHRGMLGVAFHLDMHTVISESSEVAYAKRQKICVRNKETHHIVA